ncbi:pentatricopeptide repeat-containing protein, putative [Ricinus communis]|uniref:Pentatricopeptide repeat-containing protein, putative n=1 Tax=Ricinus communis TaxID=3988 RepID=B9RLY2_RICCO|nr:pentatricopeptide repeat-containing protein, putative [Ricinus communis]
MIRAYSMSSSPIEGFYLYQEMRQKGLRADPLSLSFVIKCFVKVSSLMGGVQVHARLLRDGFQSDSLLLTNLMDLYSFCEKGTEACRVFDEIPQRDTVAWNVLISCFIRNQRTRDVLGLFDDMVSGEFGCEPDDVTCLLLVQACSNLGALEFGEKVHLYIQGHRYGDKTNLCNSLITMYSRCGCLDKAYGVFKNMPNKNVVTWSAMISGFAMNGYGRQAIETFGKMQRIGVLPDDQTFTGVLSACSHCGLVDEGMLFFDKMTQEFDSGSSSTEIEWEGFKWGRLGNLSPKLSHKVKFERSSSRSFSVRPYLQYANNQGAVRSMVASVFLKGIVSIA